MRTVTIGPNETLQVMTSNARNLTLLLTEAAARYGDTDPDFVNVLRYIPRGVDAALKSARADGVRRTKDIFLRKLGDFVADFTMVAVLDATGAPE